MPISVQNQNFSERKSVWKWDRNFWITVHICYNSSMIKLPQNIQELPLLPAHLWVISEKYKRQSSHPFLFNPNRAFLRLEKKWEYDNTISGDYAMVLCYKWKDPEVVKRICKFGFTIYNDELVWSQFQWIHTPKAKSFFHSMNLEEFLRDSIMEYCRVYGFRYAFKTNMDGIEWATENARARLSKFLQ